MISMIEQITVQGWLNIGILLLFGGISYLLLKNYSKINSFLIMSRTAARLDKDTELIQLVEVVECLDIEQRLVLLQKMIGPSYSIQLLVNGNRVSISGLGNVQGYDDQDPPDYAG